MPTSSTPTLSFNSSDPDRLPDPIVIELENGMMPLQVAKQLRHLPKLLVMESAMRHPTLGRYSFVTADPVDWFEANPNDPAETFAWLDSTLSKFQAKNLKGIPPFQGGVAGLFDYEFNRAVEPVLAAEINDVSNRAPAAIGVYDVVVAWDHAQEKAWLIVQGADAQKRADSFLKLIQGKAESQVREGGRLTTADLNHRLNGANLRSDFTRAEYLRMIDRAIEFIRAGDIFQVNLAQHLTHPAICDSLELYERLRECNAATFAGFLDLGDRQIISASPERLVSVNDNHIETRPIKGTRRRTKHPEVDINVGRELLESEKDRAENVMIVDLMRNDLSRVCLDDSVRVTQLVELEEYASVLHLVSAVEGQLENEVSRSDLLRAVFPGGSITGAPKIRAMEIIRQLETKPRGAYCGSMGYFGFNGNVDLNILIRTITAENSTWHFPVGGGITIHSDAEMEYEETWTKAKGMLDAMGQGSTSP